MLETKDGVRVAAVSSSTGKYVDLQRTDNSLPTCLKALLGLPDGLARAAAALQKGEQAGQWIEGSLLAPIPRPGKVICIGLNYRDHAEESNLPIPTEPVCFSKFSQAVVGPNATIVLPRVAHKVDYEAELVVIIGRRGKNIPQRDAMSYVAGYTNGNDVSARDWQIGRPGGQWLMGKTPDTFAPIGPYLVTADEVPNPGELRIQLRLNGETLQNSSTRELIFKIDELIAHLSQLITLEPGDLIFTGTPPGVGAARKPPMFLNAGDTVEVEVAGLGILKNPVAAE
jgi:2-keto-4-pentenoate hydratase/2-oxohepta-3-ene-1,7-dioic acid hydratase in catechol pathway